MPIVRLSLPAKPMLAVRLPVSAAGPNAMRVSGAIASGSVDSWSSASGSMTQS